MRQRQRRDGMQGVIPCWTSILRILFLSYLFPNHRDSKWQVLEHPISTSEVTPLPFPQVQMQRTTFVVADPMELSDHAPLVRPIRRGSVPPC